MDEYFIDWESSTFGLGYGTGEPHTISAVRRFLELCPESGGYDFQILEEHLTPTVTWLLINRFGRGVGLIEYGTSPRYAWLTNKGKRLREYMLSKTIDELVDLTQHDEDYWTCLPDACNCGPNGYQAGIVCQNPFWVDHPIAHAGTPVTFTRG